MKNIFKTSRCGVLHSVILSLLFLASGASFAGVGWGVSGVFTLDTLPEVNAVYRFYSYGAQESTYTHLWTISEAERDVVLTWPSWQFEGTAWYAVTNEENGVTPLYRLYEPNIRRHLYTINAAEYVALENTSWNGEGVQYYVYATNSVSGSVPVFRFYHSANQNHHFTIDENEKNTIIATPEWGYAYEGIGFYVFASNPVSSLRFDGKPASSSDTASNTELQGVRHDNSGALTHDLQTAASGVNDFSISSQKQVALATEGFGCNDQGRSVLFTNYVVAWGDLHSHTVYSHDAAERELCTNTPYDALVSCADKLDFVAITDHAEKGSVGEYTIEKWTNCLHQEQVFQAQNPQCVVFPAFEYTKTGLTQPLEGWPIPDANGHKNFYFKDFQYAPPMAYGFDYDEYSNPTSLWAYLDAQVSSGHYICIPHHSAKGSEPSTNTPPIDLPISMGTDWNLPYVNSEIMPLVEIYSRHGNSEIEDCEEAVHRFRTNASVAAALDMWFVSDYNPAYKLGIIASTDTHDGRPGNVEENTNNVQQRLGPYTGGLAATLVPAKNRDEIWNALTSKLCYATSGGRIGMEFTAKLGDQLAPMGETLYHSTSLTNNAAGMVNLHLYATADTSTGVLTRVMFYRNSECVLDQSGEWTGSVHIDYTDYVTNDYAYYRAKVWQAAQTVTPDCQFERAWSSPIWIEFRQDDARSAVYRLYSYGASESTFEHLWTTSEAEKDVLDSWASWEYEGVAWFAYTNQVAGTVPLYRLYAASVKQHHYTIDTNEYAVLDGNGTWAGEGVQYHVCSTQESGTLPAYRFYHSGLALHHFTIDENEKSAILANPGWGYEYEGVGYYVFMSNSVQLAVENRDSKVVTSETAQSVSVDSKDVFTDKLEYNGYNGRYVAVYDKQTEEWIILRFAEKWQDHAFDCQDELLIVPGDYDGDGLYDWAWYEEATGNWFIRFAAEVEGDGAFPPEADQPSAGSFFQWGGYGMSAVSGDYDGDSISDLAVYHGSSGKWFITTLAGNLILWDVLFGGPGFDPVSLDYDKDGVHDLAVRDTAGVLHVISLDGRLLK